MVTQQITITAKSDEMTGACEKPEGGGSHWYSILLVVQGMLFLNERGGIAIYGRTDRGKGPPRDSAVSPVYLEV